MLSSFGVVAGAVVTRRVVDQLSVGAAERYNRF